MKMIPALTCITICFFITPRSVNAQELGDTRQIRILIEDLDDPSRATGLSTESLRDLVLVGLKRGVPKLKVTEQITNAVLDVHITSSQLEYNRGLACHVKVSVLRPAYIIADSGKQILSTDIEVWHRDALLVWPPDAMAVRIRDAINSFLFAFALEYYRDNAPAPSRRKT